MQTNYHITRISGPVGSFHRPHLLPKELVPSAHQLLRLLPAATDERIRLNGPSGIQQAGLLLRPTNYIIMKNSIAEMIKYNIYFIMFILIYIYYLV